MAQQLWRFHSVVFLLFILTACNGQVSPTPVLTQQPTLTPLPTDWGQTDQVTVELEQADTLELAVDVATDTPTVVSTTTPMAESTATPEPPTAVPPTSTPSPTATEPPPPPTETPIPTIFAPTPLPTESPEDTVQTAAANLIAVRSQFDGPVQIPLLREKIRQVQLQVREITFMLARSANGAAFTCQNLVPAYEFMLEETPVYSVDGAMLLANLHYNRAVNRAIVGLNPLFERCKGLRTPAGNFAPIENDDLKPSDFGVAYDQGLQVSADINDALLWINGDDSKSRNLYQSLRSTLRNLGEHYELGDTSRCDEIVEIYKSVEELPELTVQPGPRLDAYRNYLDAINFLLEGSDTLNLHCEEQLERNNGTPESEGAGLPLPPELLKVAELTRRRALTAAEAAIALLPQPTPVATLPLVGGQILSVERGPNATYVIRVRVTYVSGLEPVSVTIGDFRMASDGVVTIVHTCELDFFDEVVFIDRAGARYESAKLTLERPEYCQG